MKNVKTLKEFSVGLLFGTILVACYFMLTKFAFADDAVAMLTPPDWMNTIVNLMLKLPYLGAGVVFVVKWAGLLAGVMTALSAFVQGLSQACQKAAVLVGMQGVADKVKAISDKILPYLQYLSMFNVQKPNPPVVK